MRNYLATLLLVLPTLSAIAGEDSALTQGRWATGTVGAAVVNVNWGRYWKCGPYENAQLTKLSFAPITDPDQAIDLVSPSRVAVDNSFVPYPLALPPGKFVLSSFEVKVAKSVTEVGYLRASRESLVKDGQPLASFSIALGEVIYLGHVGLDCAQQPMPWRFYIDGRKDFERFASEVRSAYPYLKGTPVRFRIISTSTFGDEFSMPESDATVQ